MKLATDASNRDIRNVVVKLDATSTTNTATLATFGQGAFFAHKAGAQTIATGTVQQMTADTEIVDAKAWYAANAFTPLQAGYYLLFGSLYVTNDTDWSSGEKLSLFIRKNAATPAYIAKGGECSSTVNATASGGVSIMVILAANGTTDYFDLAASHTDGETISISDVTFGGVFVANL